MSSDWIEIRGAREHDLRNVSVRIPRERLVVITGCPARQVVARVRHPLRRGAAALRRVALGVRAAVPRADGQARRRLHRGPVAGHLDRPEDDLAQPALDGRHGHRDLRLPAPAVRAGRAPALPRLRPADRRPVGRADRRPGDGAARRARGSRSTRRSSAGRKGEFKDLFESLRGEGFTRVKVDGETRLLEEGIELDKKFKHDIAVVVDRLVMKDDLRKRLADSVETGAGAGRGPDRHRGRSTARPTTYSEKFACPEHGVSLPELAPRVFSFNSPHGACPACHGLGATPELDPDMIVPDAEVSICRRRAAAVERVRLELLRERDPGRRRPLRRVARDGLGRPARRAAQAVPVRHRTGSGCSSPTRTARAASAST